MGLIVGEMAMGPSRRSLMKRRYKWNEEAEIEQAIIKGIAFGFPKSRAAKHAGIHRTTLFRWLERKPEFARNFARAWEEGSKQRDFLLWLNHPFRDKRPPTSKRSRSFPRYGKPRLKR